jgi:hypothetical protein
MRLEQILWSVEAAPPARAALSIGVLPAVFGRSSKKANQTRAFERPQYISRKAFEGSGKFFAGKDDSLDHNADDGAGGRARGIERERPANPEPANRPRRRHASGNCV